MLEISRSSLDGGSRSLREGPEKTYFVCSPFMLPGCNKISSAISHNSVVIPFFTISGISRLKTMNQINSFLLSELLFSRSFWLIATGAAIFHAFVGAHRTLSPKTAVVLVAHSFKVRRIDIFSIFNYYDAFTELTFLSYSPFA